MRFADLTGTWRLRSWRNLIGDRTDEPLGPDPVGYIMYSADGYMSVAMMAPDPPSHAGPVVHLSYAGPFEVLPARVIHHVEVCSRESWVGRSLIRLAQFEGDLLCLGTEPRNTDKGVHSAELVWERVSPRRA